MVLVCILMPNSLNNTVSKKELHILMAETQTDEDEIKIKNNEFPVQKKQLSSFKMICSKSSIFCLLIIWVSTFASTFYWSWISIHFTDLGFNEAGGAFAISL